MACAPCGREHSETAYMTGRAIDFVREAGDNPWSLHLSYIKPHWPYMAPAPYHDIYGPEDVLPAVRSNQEKDSPHPVVAAFMNHGESVVLSSQSAREHVIPTYMGLVKEIDDQIGRLIKRGGVIGAVLDAWMLVPGSTMCVAALVPGTKIPINARRAYPWIKP